ncbi:Ig-like domain-containing protein, partial [Neobacillus sp. NPDC093127]|uniref:Ig-like domain-containing protein n=1 Tax=Neobacillus sp. NPDC093127 TaxID=3364296 RepID=UPI0037F24C85
MVFNHFESFLVNTKLTRIYKGREDKLKMKKRTKKPLLSMVLAVVLLLATFLPTGFINKAQAQIADHVVISQVYGGGGNAGAQYKYDFIELYNPTNQQVSLEGWSVQYAGATGTSWSVTKLSGTIKAHGYYLIQEASSGSTGLDLPTSDILPVGNLNLSGTTGKVALFNKTTAATGSTPTGYIDFIGYGTTANAYEGSGAAPTLSNTTSAHRRPNATENPSLGKGNGWDTDNNKNDFVALAPNPRNSASPIEPSIDVIAPDAPVVDQVTDADEVIRGTAEADSTVVAKVNNLIIGSAKADQIGHFEIQITKQKSGTTIFVTAADAVGNVSIAKEVVVQHKITQVAPVKSNVAPGVVSAGIKIELSTSTEDATIYYTTNGNKPTEASTKYTSPILINQDTTIKALATATGSEDSDIATFNYTILDETAPEAPVVNPIRDFEVMITGTSEADAKVVAKVNGSIIGSTTANPIGQYKIQIPKQVAGTKIAITAIDAAQNESAATEVIVQHDNSVALSWTEDSSSALFTNGYWYKDSSQLYTDNSSIHTYQKGASAELTFYGSGIRWIALTSPWYGLADVYIDGVFVKEANLFSNNIRYSQLVFEDLSLEKGIHTIKLVNKGLVGNDLGKGVYINIDAIEVIESKDITAPTIPTLLMEKKLALNKSSLSWNSNKDIDLKGYNIYRSLD